MRNVIRLGDPTTHGGVVLTASSTTRYMGRPVARMGDLVTCPIKGHTQCVIAEGDPEWVVDGQRVALDGAKTSCGAVLIATLQNAGRK
jgi:uncharacterized Zn-binding protein involved in type VI secretion